mmetsp:Transcript_21802/g.38667  ORF Transcript_21802/g.38667 Transcript_21802/m.38667 type:complete len:341 (-) Transcript_21802:268-1290(-)
MPIVAPVGKKKKNPSVRGKAPATTTVAVAAATADNSNRTIHWLICLSVVSGLFGVLELLAVYRSLSLALIADAMHTLMDCLCYVVNLITEVKVQRDITEQSKAGQEEEQESLLDNDQESQLFCGEIPTSDQDICNWGIMDIIQGRDCSSDSGSICPCDDIGCGDGPQSANKNNLVLSPVSNKWVFGGTLLTALVMFAAAIWVAIDASMGLYDVYNNEGRENDYDTAARNTLIIVSVVGFSLRFGLLISTYWLPQLHSYHHIPGERCNHSHKLHLIASLLHLIADQLESVVLVLVAILISLGYNPSLVDAVGSLVISTMVMYLSMNLLSTLYTTKKNAVHV